MRTRGAVEIRIGMLQVIDRDSLKKSSIFNRLEVNNTVGNKILSDMIDRKLVFYENVKGWKQYSLSPKGKSVLAAGLTLLEDLFK